VSGLGGCSPSANSLEVKASEAQGRHREVGSEGSGKPRSGPVCLAVWEGRVVRPPPYPACEWKGGAGKAKKAEALVGCTILIVTEREVAQLRAVR
jgi:hypothetical protein